MGKIFLTGPPGCGKTTVIRKLAQMLPEAAGFFTKEIREGGARNGFMLVDLRTGKERVLSHVSIRGSTRVGKYGVDIDGFENFLGHLDIESPVLVIDEIGKMECLSPGFRSFIEGVLGSERILVATIALKGTTYIEALKGSPGTRIVTVTHVNRDTLPDKIMHMLNI